MTTPYHPRANGQNEETNGILGKTITKMVQGSMAYWDSKIIDALWAYHIVYKVMTKFTTFQLVYGQEEILPMGLKLPSLRIAIDERLGDKESLEVKIYLI